MLFTTFQLCLCGTFLKKSNSSIERKESRIFLIRNLNTYREYTSIEAQELSLHSKTFAVLGEVLEGLEASLSPAGQHNQEPRRGSDVVNGKVAKKCKKKKPFFITLLVLDDGYRKYIKRQNLACTSSVVRC